MISHYFLEVLHKERKMKKEPDILCVSCSEAVFKLGGIEFDIGTDGYPNELVDKLIANKDKIKLPCVEELVEAKLTDAPLFGGFPKEFPEGKGYYEYVENRGGGAKFGYIEDVLAEFIKFKLGQITEEEFRKRDAEIWRE